MLSAILVMDDNCFSLEHDLAGARHVLPALEQPRQVVGAVDCSRLGFRPEQLCNLDAPRLPGRCPARQTRPAPLTIDLDSTIVSVCGRGKQGAAFG
jgi:hypothetical protein